MNKKMLKDYLIWGFLLWLTGYVLGIVLFMILPVKLIGWVIMPIGIVLTIWVLRAKIGEHRTKYFILLGLIWMLIAISLDYVFIVKMLKPADGYYKFDVYLYYLFTGLMPVIIGKKRRVE